MSNSGSVGGSGGVDLPSSPYTNGTPDQSGKTGRTNDQRTVRVRHDTGESQIPGKPDDSNTPPPSPLAKRKVARHSVGKKLKSMPDGGGFKPLGGSKRTDLTGSTQSKNPQTGQVEPQHGANAQVSVELAKPGASVPPLTEEQQEQKSKLIGAFTTALRFIKQHKNSFAMGGGAALMVVGIALMAFPPTAVIGIWPAVMGYTMAVTGFSFGMTNMDTSGPGPSPEPPKDESKEEDEKKKRPDDSSSTASSTQPKGRFAMVNYTTSTPTPKQVDSEETSVKEMAKKRELRQFQQMAIGQIKAKIKQDAEIRASLGDEAKALTVSPTLEEIVIDIAAESFTRTGVNADQEVLDKIVESGKLVARTRADADADADGMSEGERLKAFQTLYTSLAQNGNIPNYCLELLYGGFDEVLTSQKDLLSDEVKTMLSSTSALLKAIIEKNSALAAAQNDTSIPQLASLAELEAFIDGIHDYDTKLKNVVHLRQLRDAVEAHGKKTKLKVQEVEQIKRGLYTDALDLVRSDLSQAEFKAALLAKINPSDRKVDHDFLNEAFQQHLWFKEK